MVHIVWGIALAVLGVIAWHLKTANSAMCSQLEAVRRQSEALQKQLAEAVEKLAEYEERSAKSSGEGLFQRAVEGLVALGVARIGIARCCCNVGLRWRSGLNNGLSCARWPLGHVGWCWRSASACFGIKGASQLWISTDGSSGCSRTDRQGRVFRKYTQETRFDS